MHRRFLRFAAIAVLLLSACATNARREFVSDRISVIARGSGPEQPPNVEVPEDQFDASMAGLYANAANATLVRIDDSRHFIQWDQPARFITEIDAFMTR